MQAADDWVAARRVRSFRIAGIALGVAAVAEAQFAAMLLWAFLVGAGSVPLWSFLVMALHFVGLVTACGLSSHASARRPNQGLLTVSVLASLGLTAVVISMITSGLRLVSIEFFMALLFAFRVFCLGVIAWALGVNARSRGHRWTWTRWMIVAVLAALVGAWSVAWFAWQSPSLHPVTMRRTVLAVATLDVVLVLALATIAIVLMARRIRPE